MIRPAGLASVREEHRKHKRDAENDGMKAFHGTLLVGSFEFQINYIEYNYYYSISYYCLVSILSVLFHGQGRRVVRFDAKRYRRWGCDD